MFDSEILFLTVFAKSALKVVRSLAFFPQKEIFQFKNPSPFIVQHDINAEDKREKVFNKGIVFVGMSVVPSATDDSMLHNLGLYQPDQVHKTRGARRIDYP